MIPEKKVGGWIFQSAWWIWK